MLGVPAPAAKRDEDPEVENPYDEGCDDFGGPVAVDEDDPNHLVRDGDGIGCE